eukprot:gb/GECG01013117.1/.p1 GENE.gb/GECG01013117.1/~~gb/GECG01013117.1/.p1  ORF type:complete len:1066 (+),score=121.31 gb/GECG01013117.1/:1-3198(+)
MLKYALQGPRQTTVGTVLHHYYPDSMRCLRSRMAKARQASAFLEGYGRGRSFEANSSLTVQRKCYHHGRVASFSNTAEASNNNSAANGGNGQAAYLSNQEAQERSEEFYHSLQSFTDIFEGGYINSHYNGSRYIPGGRDRLALNSDEQRIMESLSSGRTLYNGERKTLNLSAYPESIRRDEASYEQVPDIEYFDSPPRPEKIRRQYELETRALEETVNKYRKVVSDVMKIRKGSSLGPAQRLLSEWFVPLTRAIDEEQAAVTHGDAATDRNVYGPYLLLLKPDKLAVIAMHETLNLVLSFGGAVKVVQVMTAIGEAVRAEVNMVKLKSKDRRLWTQLQGPMDGKKMRRLRQGAKKAIDGSEWPRGHVLKLGGVLVDCLLKSSFVDVPRDFAEECQDEFSLEDGQKTPENEKPHAKRNEESWRFPAFVHRSRQSSSTKRIGEIRCHPYIQHLLENNPVSNQQAMSFPMVVPPKPWRAPNSGGYLKQRIPLMRFRGSKLQGTALKHAHIPQVYEGLNCLGRVPFQINHDIHDIVKQVWENGGGIAEIPSRSDVSLPAEPDFSQATDEQEENLMRKRYRLSVAKSKQTNSDLHSLRCDMSLKLQVADMFRNEEAMYFPFNLDFRGRAYPVPPHLNHMGSDVCRGLLKFGVRKRLGERGLRWTKIHLSNLMGVDKVSFDDRVNYVEENWDKVMDSARAPLESEQWWLTGDSPWQALATCIELYNAYSCSSPEDYESSLPVHQDGSCNGLQHYAALGRDEHGGRAVNLRNADKPQDVYTEVLQLVLKKVEDESNSTGPPSGSEATEHEIRSWKQDKEAANFVSGFVDRKVVKQTVMTSVYGVTFIGAREQIRARLEERFDPAVNEVAAQMHVDELENALWNASRYLAKVTLGSIEEIFSAADAIKEWLGNAARLVALHNQPVSWVTPLGLPVVQPYRRQQALLVKTILQDVVVVNDSDQLPVSSQRQKSAFPPNYIHSLDSTHMLLTAIDCTRRGLTFSAVHDSFWTHAADVDTMNVSIRDQFIKLYSMPLLEQFRETLQIRFPHIDFPPLPERGNLDLEEIRQSAYFFS